MFVPQIATTFPQRLQSEMQATPAEEVDDSMNRLEEDPLKGLQLEEQPEK
jgi:hypothetical protein